MPYLIGPNSAATQPSPKSATSSRFSDEKRNPAAAIACTPPMAPHGQAQLYRNLSLLHAEAGAWEAALEAARDAAKLAPGDEAIRHHLASLLAR